MKTIDLKLNISNISKKYPTFTPIQSGLLSAEVNHIWMLRNCRSKFPHFVHSELIEVVERYPPQIQEWSLMIFPSLHLSSIFSLTTLPILPTKAGSIIPYQWQFKPTYFELKFSDIAKASKAKDSWLEWTTHSI